MKISSGKRIARGCFLALGMATTMACAQLSTSVSPLLDTGLSNVAPTTSIEIEPGASNLLTPVERLPYDAIGASIEATALSPMRTQHGLVGQMPFQVDASLSNATVLTGQHSQLAPRMAEMMSGMPGSGASFSSRQSSVSPPSAYLQPSSATPALGPASSGLSLLAAFRSQSTSSGKSTRQLSAPGTIQAFPQSAQSQENRQSSDKAAGLSRNDNRNAPAQGSSQPAQSSTEQSRDFSKSPLESSVSDDRSSGVSISTSFDDFNQKVFLNPDILSASSHGSTKSGSSLGARTGLSSSGSSLAAHTRTGLSSRSEFGSKTQVMRDQSAARLESQFTKISSNLNSTKKPQWHNPILVQMESDASSRR